MTGNAACVAFARAGQDRLHLVLNTSKFKVGFADADTAAPGAAAGRVRTHDESVCHSGLSCDYQCFRRRANGCRRRRRPAGWSARRSSADRRGRRAATLVRNFGATASSCRPCSWRQRLQVRVAAASRVARDTAGIALSRTGQNRLHPRLEHFVVQRRAAAAGVAVCCAESACTRGARTGPAAPRFDRQQDRATLLALLMLVVGATGETP